MTVNRRPVVSWKPQSVGKSGFDRVATRKRVQSPPSDTQGLISPAQGPWITSEVT